MTPLWYGMTPHVMHAKGLAKNGLTTRRAKSRKTLTTESLKILTITMTPAKSFNMITMTPAKMLDMITRTPAKRLTTIAWMIGKNGLRARQNATGVVRDRGLKLMALC